MGCRLNWLPAGARCCELQSQIRLPLKTLARSVAPGVFNKWHCSGFKLCDGKMGVKLLGGWISKTSCCILCNGGDSGKTDRLQMAWTSEQEEEEEQEQVAVSSALHLAPVNTSGCAASLRLYRCHMSSLCAGVQRCLVRGVPSCTAAVWQSG